MQEKNLEKTIASPAVRYWLLLGVVMVFGQVWLGGVTRLTGSGLSMTEWKPILGVLPPLNEIEWQEAFTKYREATVQYAQINVGMEMGAFKWIYFWEFTHRLWARMMGLVFLFPFLFFWWRGMLDKTLVRRLGYVIAASAFAATFGWLMVFTGIKGNDLANPRAWVNAYALSVHLGIGFLVFSTLWWATVAAWQGIPQVINNIRGKRMMLCITVLVGVQVIFGGWMSGMKAGLAYPSFPLMNGEILPAVLFDPAAWTTANITQYDHNAFAPALIQILHRFTAYLLVISVLWYWNYIRKQPVSMRLVVANNLLLVWIFVQILLGVLTLLQCVGHIPLTLGVLHQDGALVLLAICLYINYQYSNSYAKKE
jgi:cytochrome c oxidase assembly protein subunit 15